MESYTCICSNLRFVKNRGKNTLWMFVLDYGEISLEDTGNTGCLEEEKVDGTGME